MIALPTIDRTRLAADFSGILRDWHTVTQLEHINTLNAGETDPLVDHIHDYRDANLAMHCALVRQIGTLWSWDEVLPDIEAAWAHARTHNFHVMRILIACEFSGTVREAFTLRGHSASYSDISAKSQVLCL